MNKHHKKNSSIKRLVLLYIMYTFLFLTLFFFLDMYDLFVYNPYILGVASFIIGGVLAYFHVKNGQKTRIDDLVDKL